MPYQVQEVEEVKASQPQYKYGVCNSRFFDNFAKPQATKIFYGGAGSGKSLSIAQHFIIKLCSGDGQRRAILRKTFPSMMVSTYLVLKDILEDWGVGYKENKTKHFFQVGKNQLYYLSLDNPEKIKGGEFKEIWLEESTEFTENDYRQLQIRLSRDRNNEDVELYMSFNPIDVNNWCVKLLEQARNEDKDFLVMHSTYHDNIRFLSRAFIRKLEKLIKEDYNFYRVYCLGEPGVLKNIIFTNYVEENPKSWPDFGESDLLTYGLDFGFNHPTALIQINFVDAVPYVQELYYKSKKTTEYLYIWMNEKGVSHTAEIYADSARPDQIDYLCEDREINGVYYRGFNVLPGKKDVAAGIDAVKSRLLHISSEAANVLKEIKSYKFKENKDGQIIDEPVKFNDDAMDAIRYAIFSSDTVTGEPITMSRPDIKKYDTGPEEEEEENEIFQLNGGDTMPQFL